MSCKNVDAEETKGHKSLQNLFLSYPKQFCCILDGRCGRQASKYVPHIYSGSKQTTMISIGCNPTQCFFILYIYCFPRTINYRGVLWSKADFGDKLPIVPETVKEEKNNINLILSQNEQYSKAREHANTFHTVTVIINWTVQAKKKERKPFIPDR